MSRKKVQEPKIVRTPTRAFGGITDDERAKMGDLTQVWIKRAFRTDPIKREKFDRTGKMNDAPDTQQTEIMQLLSTLLISVIQADFDLAMTDLRTVIRSRLKVDREKLLEARDQLTKAKFRIAVLLARLKPSKGEGNVSLIELTEQHQRAVNLEAEKLEAKIEVYAKAMAVVDDHGYEVTVPQSAYMSGNTTSSTFFNF